MAPHQGCVAPLRGSQPDPLDERHPAVGVDFAAQRGKVRGADLDGCRPIDQPMVDGPMVDGPMVDGPVDVLVPHNGARRGAVDLSGL